MDRPKINPSPTIFDIVLEGLAALFVIWMIVILIADYPSIPERVPTHFNAAGRPDDWGSKASMLILPVVSIVLYAGLTVLNRYPYIFIYPFEITEKNAGKHYRLAKTMVTFLKMTLTGSFLFIQLKSMEVASGMSGGLGSAFIFILLAGTFIPIIVYFIVASRIK